MKSRNKRPTGTHAFSFIEALVTIALLGVLSAIVVSSYSDASSQSHGVIARQQAAAVKSALDSYVNGSLSKVPTGTINVSGVVQNRKTVSQLRADYNTASTTAARWLLIQPYLSDDVNGQDRFRVRSDGDLGSSSLDSDKKALRLDSWVVAPGAYPEVKIIEK